MIKLGLRIRFFLYSNTLIVVTMTLVAVLGAIYQRGTYLDAIVSRGRSLVEAMAIPITYIENGPEVGEAGLVERYVAEVMARNLDVMSYVVVTDAAGTVTHSSRPEMMGRPFARALAGESIGDDPLTDERRGDDGEDLLEIRTTLAEDGRLVGTLAVGFSLGPIERTRS